MKKISRVFVIFSMILIGAFGAAAVLLAGISRIMSAAAVIAGAAVWTAAFARFRSIEYIDDGERLVIRRGVFFRAETSLKRSGILYVTTVKIGSVTLFSVLHTASGAVVVFAEFILKTSPDAGF